MKKILLALCMVLSVCAFAQETSFAGEMDTTYAITDDGETVGLIHRKGEIPIVPEGMRLVDEASVAETAEQPVAEPVEQPVDEPVVDDDMDAPVPQAVRVGQTDYSKNERFKNLFATTDSIAYYQDMVDRYNRAAQRRRTTSKWLMIGGGIAAAVGTVILLSDMSDDYVSGDGVGFFVLGNVVGAGALISGVFVSRSAKTRQLKALEYEEKLMSYKNRHVYALGVSPLVNPVNKSLGGAMTLNF